MEIIIHSIEDIEIRKIKYSVIMAHYKDQWIFVRHKERKTWEMPGGRIEPNESIFQCASRELTEETGAANFTIVPSAIYEVRRQMDQPEEDYGLLCYAYIHQLGRIPEGSEIKEKKFFTELPAELTYPEIAPVLYDYMLKNYESYDIILK